MVLMNQSRIDDHKGCFLLEVLLYQHGETPRLALRRQEIFWTWMRQIPNQTPEE